MFDHLPCADEVDDPVLLLVRGVDISMHDPWREMEEITCFDRKTLPTLGSELKNGLAFEQVGVDVPVAVMMPSRRHTPVHESFDHDVVVRVEGDTPDDPRRLTVLYQTLYCHNSRCVRHLRTSTIRQ